MSYGNPQGSTGEQGGAGHEPQVAGGPPHWGPDGFSRGAGPSHGGYGVPPGGGRGYGPPEGGYGAPAGFGTSAGWSGNPPPNYLPWAIIATIGGVLFSLIGGVPTGLVSAHFARQVMRRWQAGDRQGALEAARKARTWAIVSTVLDVLGLIFVVYLFSSNKNGTVG